MAAGPIVDPGQLLHGQLAQASPDLMRELLQTFINSLLSAQADAVCGADHGTRTTARTNRRNGYRHRDTAPASAPWTWRSPGCAKAASSPTGCWSGAAAPRLR